MKRNKKFYIIVTSLLFIMGIAGFYIWFSTPVIADTPLRLHIIANSDDSYDQEVKLLLRNEVLDYLTDKFAEVDNKYEAMAVLKESLPELETVCNDFLSGFDDYKVDLELGKSDFPTRSYGEMVLPAGEYDALRIIIGNGEGKNWWCVLFPPLCFVDFATTKEVNTTSGSGTNNSAVEASGGSTLEVRLLINDLLRQ